MIRHNDNIDQLTKLPNFISFVNDDYEEVYGSFGSLLMVKIKNLREINRIYGRDVGDHLIKTIGSYLFNEVSEKTYRHEGNGFLIVYKELDETQADHHFKLLNERINEVFEIHDMDLGFLWGLKMHYDEPILSLADYYQLYYYEYLKEKNLKDSKEMLHYVFEGLSYRIKDIIKSYRDIKDYALYDEISELPNSKCANLFFDVIDEKLDEYAILFIDGDDLSRFNQVSYEYGNTAIKEMAQVIQSSIRKTDKLYRWLSGDEFVVVLTDISENSVSILAERIRMNVETHFSTKDIKATVSIGISKYPDNANTVHQVISTAELANKQAKANGKNQYVYFD